MSDQAIRMLLVFSVSFLVCTVVTWAVVLFFFPRILRWIERRLGQ